MVWDNIAHANGFKNINRPRLNLICRESVKVQNTKQSEIKRVNVQKRSEDTE